MIMMARLLILLSIIVLQLALLSKCADYEEDDVIYCRRNETVKMAPFMTPAQLQENSLLKNRTFVEDRSVVFPVSFSYGCPVPNLGQWYKDEEPIDPSNDLRLTVDLPSFRLTLKKARVDDTGDYRFVVKNSEGVLEFVFRITVTGAPYWCPSAEGAPVSNVDCNCLPHDFDVGTNLILNCNVCANETALVTWYTGREGEGELEPVFKHLDTRILITETVNTSTLSLQFLKPHDDGRLFECQASNRFGNFSFRWLLRQIQNERPILKPPLILNVLNATASVGSTAKLVCNLALTGDELLAETIWLRGDYVRLVTLYNVTQQNTKDASRSRSAVYLIPKLADVYPELRKNTSDNVFELDFSPVTVKDYGPYTCYYTNNAGAAAKVVWLIKPPEESGSDVVPIAVGICVGAIVLAVVVVVLTVLLCRRRGIAFKPVKKRIIVMTNNEFYNNLDLDQIHDHEVRIELASNRAGTVAGANPVTSSVARSRYIMDPDPRWEIPRSKIVMGDSIGGGNIGLVVSAKLLDHYGEKSRDVAVKMLRDDATDDDLLQLIKELMLLKQVGAHPNVINFFGCCTQNGPVLVVVELARYGNLRDFLRRHRPPEPEADYCLPSPSRAVSISDWSNGSAYSVNDAQDKPLMLEGNMTLTYRHLVEFAQQIAKGMEYLSSKGCIHRDLAARNVLVADNFQLKVSDFGLTRRVVNISTDYYRRGNAKARLPLKWMAPESLIDSKYTTKSDVWSYGILLWEIYSLGENPYRDLSGYDEIVEFVIPQGRRLECPKYADKYLYEKLFLNCWNFNPEERPSFREIRLLLEECGQYAPNVPLGSIPSAHSTPSLPNGALGFLGGVSVSRINAANRHFPPLMQQQDRLPSINEPNGANESVEIDQVVLTENDDSGEGESSSSSTTDEPGDSNKPPSSPGVVTNDSQYSSLGNNAIGSNNFTFSTSTSSPQRQKGLLSLPRNHRKQNSASKERLSSTSSDTSAPPVMMTPDPVVTTIPNQSSQLAHIDTCF